MRTDRSTGKEKIRTETLGQCSVSCTIPVSQDRVGGSRAEWAGLGKQAQPGVEAESVSQDAVHEKQLCDGCQYTQLPGTLTPRAHGGNLPCSDA